MELKTSAEIENERDAIKFERKLLKFWAQSFLLGVPKIIVGFRTKDGILRRLEGLETKDIPTKVQKHGRGTWNGNVCINFAASFLDCMLIYQRWSEKNHLHELGLKQSIKGEGVWRIRRREKSSIIELFKKEESGYGDILSPEFIEWRNGKTHSPSPDLASPSIALESSVSSSIANVEGKSADRLATDERESPKD